METSDRSSLSDETMNQIMEASDYLQKGARRFGAHQMACAMLIGLEGWRYSHQNNPIAIEAVEALANKIVEATRLMIDRELNREEESK